MVNFNHLMLYVTDIERSIQFYHRLIGMELLAREKGYARLKSRGDNTKSTTIALHRLTERRQINQNGIRIYFQVENLEEFCDKLKKNGCKIEQEPKKMPWGWEHAYLKDPDGYEISVYNAGGLRLKKEI